MPGVRDNGNTWSDLSLVDLRPEQRSLNKNYMYAEVRTRLLSSVNHVCCVKPS